MIKYAGVDLLLPTPELEEWIDKYFPLDFTEIFQIFAGDLCGYFTQPFPTNGSVRLNTLVWPRDAGRWSYGCFLATTSMIEQINLVVDSQYVSGYGSGSGWCSGSGSSGMTSGNCLCSGSGSGVSGGGGSFLNGALLQMSSAANSAPAISCKMFMLPPTPIARVPWNRSSLCPEAHEGLWLVTLVDERFWWNMRGLSSDTIIGGDWNNMNAAMLTDIGQTAGTIQSSANYGLMPTQLADCPWQPQMAQVLDCYLYQTQKRLVRSLTGAVSIVGPEMAKLLLLANAQTDFSIIAGGGSRMSPLVAWSAQEGAVNAIPVIPWKECQDLRHILPRGITFIKPDGSYLTLDNPYVTPAAANRYKIFRVKYTVPNAFYQSFAKDWFEWRRSHFEATIPGLFAWNPTGFEDYIEFHHGSTMSYTRIVKNQVNDLTGKLTNCLCEYGETEDGLAEVVTDVLCQAGKTTVKYRKIDARYVD